MRLAFAAAAALLLAACATVPRPAAEQSWAGRFAATASLGEWRDSVSGRFLLERSGDRLSLDLSSPIGGTVARIEVDATGARARGLQVAETHGADAEALAQQLLGFRLPVRGLPDWIEGRAMPGSAAELSPPQGTIERIEQDGWTITVLERDSTGAPRRLLMQRAELADTPAVKLQLVLDPPPAP